MNPGRFTAPLAFLVVMFALTWAPAAFVAPMLSAAADPAATRLLKASVLYAALMTFQPLIALAMVKRWFDPAPVDVGLRQAPPRWQSIAIVGPLLLAGVAASIALLVGGAERATAVDLKLEPQFASVTGSLLLVLGFLGVVAMLWVQAMTEEIGWRGYLLPRLMQQFGPFPGLFAHGAIWGLWYAPLLIAASGGPALPSLGRCAELVVTFALLGVLLGWVRIASRSVVAAATANALLTLTAALPLVVQGSEAARTAIYLPTGWIPLAAAIAVVIATQRGVIRAFVAGSPASY